MAESILVRLEEPLASSIAMSDVQVKDPLNTAEAAMKVILIVLMLLIPAWCHADGNELLKRCGLLVSYVDGESPDVTLSGEMNVLCRLHAGHYEYEPTLPAHSQIGCAVLSSRMGNIK